MGSLNTRVRFVAPEVDQGRQLDPNQVCSQEDERGRRMTDRPCEDNQGIEEPKGTTHGRSDKSHGGLHGREDHAHRENKGWGRERQGG